MPFQPRQFCRKEAQGIRHADEDLLSGYSRCDTSRLPHNSDAGPRLFLLLPLSAFSANTAVKEFWGIILLCVFAPLRESMPWSSQTNSRARFAQGAKAQRSADWQKNGGRKIPSAGADGQISRCSESAHSDHPIIRPSDHQTIRLPSHSWNVKTLRMGAASSVRAALSRRLQQPAG